MKADSAPATYEPYTQLFRALFPRLTALSIFDAQAELLWSTEMASDNDMRSSCQTLQHAQLDPSAQGPARCRRWAGVLSAAARNC
jgi:hypothetical protein